MACFWRAKANKNEKEDSPEFKKTPSYPSYIGIKSFVNIRLENKFWYKKDERKLTDNEEKHKTMFLLCRKDMYREDMHRKPVLCLIENTGLNYNNGTQSCLFHPF